MKKALALILAVGYGLGFALNEKGKKIRHRRGVRQRGDGGPAGGGVFDAV